MHFMISEFEHMFESPSLQADLSIANLLNPNPTAFTRKQCVQHEIGDPQHRPAVRLIEQRFVSSDGVARYRQCRCVKFEVHLHMRTQKMARAAQCGEAKAWLGKPTVQVLVHSIPVFSSQPDMLSDQCNEVKH